MSPEWTKGMVYTISLNQNCIVMQNKELNGAFVVGDYRYEPTGKFQNVLEEDILKGGWLSGHDRPTAETLKQGDVFFHTTRVGISRTAFIEDSVSIPFIVVERNDDRWSISDRQDSEGNTFTVLIDNQNKREFHYVSRKILEPIYARLKEWKCEILRQTRLTDES